MMKYSHGTFGIASLIGLSYCLLVGSLSSPALLAQETDLPVGISVWEAIEQDDAPEILERLRETNGRRTQAELNAIRDRRIGSLERENQELLRELYPVVSEVRPSTFEVINPTYWVSMGTVITSDGYAITKASELEQDQPIKARFGRDKTVNATLVRVDQTNDVALLKLDAGQYTPVRFETTEPTPGNLLLSVGVRNPIMTLGACSCEARNLIERNWAIMGVLPRGTNEGIAVYNVQNAARQAGLQDGDIIVSIQGRTVTKVPEMVGFIRKHRAGDELVVTTKRGDQLLDFTVRLSAQRNIGRSSGRLDSINIMNMLGSINSQRSRSFPWVMQHDSPLLPEQCGGPLVNLQGQVVGVNIAREGRTSSLALTGEHLQDVLQGLDVPSWKRH